MYEVYAYSLEFFITFRKKYTSKYWYLSEPVPKLVLNLFLQQPCVNRKRNTHKGFNP